MFTTPFQKFEKKSTLDIEIGNFFKAYGLLNFLFAQYIFKIFKKSKMEGLWSFLHF